MASNIQFKELLVALINERSITGFRQVKRDWLMKEPIDNDFSEQEIYDIVQTHFSRYGNLPTIEQCRDYHIYLNQVEGTAQFFTDRIKNRVKLGIMHNKIIPELQSIAKYSEYDRLAVVLRESLSEIAFETDDATVSSMSREIDNVIGRYHDNRRQFSLKGVTTGWSGLDEVTEGIQPGDIFVVVARPNIGKSYLLFNMALKAYQAGHSALVCSLEMSKNQVCNRMASIQAKVRPDLLNKGRLGQYGYEQLLDESEFFRNNEGLYVMSGDMKLSVADIDAAIRQYNPDIVYIDAAYLLAPEKKRKSSDNRRETISDVLEDLKRMAINRNKPVVVTTQFNRQVKKRARAELDLSQIAETDVIGQIASVVLGVRLGNPPNETDTRILEVMKNREGPLVKFEVNFNFGGMDFSFSRMIDDNPLEATPSEDDNVDVGWMA